MQRSSGKMYLVDLAASESFDSGEGTSPSKAVLPCSALLDAGSSPVGFPVGFSPEGSQYGLHALGKVLTALAGGRTHVPYRDATLTKLLQQALS